MLNPQLLRVTPDYDLIAVDEDKIRKMTEIISESA